MAGLHLQTCPLACQHAISNPVGACPPPCRYWFLPVVRMLLYLSYRRTGIRTPNLLDQPATPGVLGFAADALRISLGALQSVGTGCAAFSACFASPVQPGPAAPIHTLTTRHMPPPCSQAPVPWAWQWLAWS